MESRSLRIALVAPLWVNVPPETYGGIELLLKLMADELVRQGHQVTLFATGAARTTATLHPVCAEPVIDMMTQGTAATYEYYANACVSDALKAADQFDLLHFHVGNQWIPLGALSPKPVLFTLHTQLGSDDSWVLGRYPQVPVAAISHCQVKSLPQPIPVVYNGCDFSRFDPSFEGDRLPACPGQRASSLLNSCENLGGTSSFEPGQYLAFLGRMSYDKNPLGAIQIAKKVGMPLVLAGNAQSAKEWAYFNTEIKPHLDDVNVRFIGEVNHEQKNSLLRGAAALLFPVQWEEPFGLVMIEAMACGTPVIAHALGSVREVVDEGVTGFYSDSIDTMHELVPRALALDRAAVRRKAEERFGYRRMVDEYLRLYRSLIDSD